MTASDANGLGKDGGKRRKGRGPRRRNPAPHRRGARVALEDMPEGARHGGWQAYTVRDIVFHAGEVTWLREVWRFPDGTQHVVPLPPGVAKLSIADGRAFERLASIDRFRTGARTGLPAPRQCAFRPLSAWHSHEKRVTDAMLLAVPR